MVEAGILQKQSLIGINSDETTIVVGAIGCDRKSASNVLFHSPKQPICALKSPATTTLAVGRKPRSNRDQYWKKSSLVSGLLSVGDAGMDGSELKSTLRMLYSPLVKFVPKKAEN